MRPKIGAHVSAAGGLYKALENATAIGAECIQLFGASPRTWRGVLPAAEQVKKFQAAAVAAAIDRIYLHASYLVNLASDKPYNREQSTLSLIDHLAIAEKLKAAGLIFHLGSAMSGTKAEALKFTVANIRQVLRAVPGKTWLIMENSAGGGNKLGYEFSEIGALLRQVKSPRLKVCLDTAHLFEAGRIDEYTKTKVKRLVDDFDQQVGLEKLVALHLNDSKTAAGSHHDRHENLGEGLIGLTGFKELAADQRLWQADWILEVPGYDNSGPDKKNIDRLKSLFHRK